MEDPVLDDEMHEITEDPVSDDKPTTTTTTAIKSWRRTIFSLMIFSSQTTMTMTAMMS